MKTFGTPDLAVSLPIERKVESPAKRCSSGFVKQCSWKVESCFPFLPLAPFIPDYSQSFLSTCS